VNVRALIDLARDEGMLLIPEGADLRVLRPKSEVTDKIVAQLKAHKAEVLAALAPCCGNRPIPNPDDYDEPVGAAFDPTAIVPRCQLCPNSPTYWRRGRS
jgi:hypothetical protein